MYLNIFRRIAYAIACLSVGFACLYGLVNVGLSTKIKHGEFSYDWHNVAQKRNIIPIAIIGSGPAGWTAAMYGARAGITSVVFEGDEPGGLLTTTGDVENYPGAPSVKGSDLMEYMRKQACEFGCRCVSDTIEEIDFSQWPFTLRTAGGESFSALTVVIATGAAPRLLNIEGEKEYWGRGVSACARCDAALPFYRNTKAIVIGGGDSAIEEAIQLEPFSSNVTIIHRRGQLRAAPHVCKRIEKYNKIDVTYNAQVKRILGDGDKITSVELEIVDEHTGQKRKEIMTTDRVFLAIGHEPRTALFKGVITTDDQGFIQCQGNSPETNITGVFAAGDVADSHYRQAITAAGKGCMAGIDAVNFLHEVGFTTHRAKQLAENIYGLESDDITKKIIKTEVCTIAGQDEFERFIGVPDNMAMVAFYTPDEAPSVRMLNIVNTAAKKGDAAVSFATLNMINHPSIAQRFHITKTPCLIVFADGRLVARYSTGIESAEELLNNIRQLSNPQAA